MLQQQVPYTGNVQSYCLIVCKQKDVQTHMRVINAEAAAAGRAYRRDVNGAAECPRRQAVSTHWRTVSLMKWYKKGPSSNLET